MRFNYAAPREKKTKTMCLLQKEIRHGLKPTEFMNALRFKLPQLYVTSQNGFLGVYLLLGST